MNFDEQAEKVFLDRVYLNFAKRMNSDRILIGNIDMQVSLAQYVADELEFRLTAWFLSGHDVRYREDVKEYDFPASLWQHVKMKIAPRWALRLWPVKMVQRSVVVAEHTYNVCPHVKANEEYPHIYWMSKGER